MEVSVALVCGAFWSCAIGIEILYILPFSLLFPLASPPPPSSCLPLTCPLARDWVFAEFMHVFCYMGVALSPTETQSHCLRWLIQY